MPISSLFNRFYQANRQTIAWIVQICGWKNEPNHRETCNLFNEQGRRKICKESASPMQITTKAEDINSHLEFLRLCIWKADIGRLRINIPFD